MWPTLLFNKTYDRPLVNSDPNVIPVVVHDDLNSTLNMINVHKDKQEQTLIVADDCSNLRDSKKKLTALTQLAFHGRHSNLSCWVITQKCNAVVKDFRENIKVLVLFYDKNKKSREAAFEENDIEISSKEKYDIVEKLKNIEKSKLIMRQLHPFQFYCC